MWSKVVLRVRVLTLEDCSAKRRGGGLHLASYSVTALVVVTLRRNVAQEGAIVFTGHSSNLEVRLPHPRAGGRARVRACVRVGEAVV